MAPTEERSTFSSILAEKQKFSKGLASTEKPGALSLLAWLLPITSMALVLPLPPSEARRLTWIPEFFISFKILQLIRTKTNWP